MPIVALPHQSLANRPSTGPSDALLLLMQSREDMNDPSSPALRVDLAEEQEPA
jgi:hypothetical protein